jgi:hypothetical protein
MDPVRYREVHDQIFGYGLSRGLGLDIMTKPTDATLEEVLEAADEMRHTYADYLVDRLKFKAVIWYLDQQQSDRFARIYNHLINNFGLKSPGTWLRHLKPYDLIWFYRELDNHGIHDLAKVIREGYETLQIPTFSPWSD